MERKNRKEEKRREGATRTEKRQKEGMNLKTLGKEHLAWKEREEQEQGRNKTLRRKRTEVPILPRQRTEKDRKV